MPKKQWKTNYDGDIFLYYGNILPDGYHAVSKIFEQKTAKKQKACLILITLGGDPNAAYRIARALNHHYGRVEILIPDICKSAGTLLCIGAHKLIIGDRGELGPLDVQISKPDELFENMSGLDIMQAVNALSEHMGNVFRSRLFEISVGCGLQTKLAADIAAKLAEGFISPIVAKLDPVTMGAHLRAMQIGYDYGKRLDEMTKSLNSDALDALLSKYPSHQFVIDRNEASTLFKSVEAPDETTDSLYREVREVVEETPYPGPNPVIIDLTNLPEEEHHETQKSRTDEQIQGRSPVSTGESEQKSPGDEPIGDLPTA